LEKVVLRGMDLSHGSVHAVVFKESHLDDAVTHALRKSDPDLLEAEQFTYTPRS